MTSRESREIFIDSILTDSQRKQLSEQGLYRKYTEGKISVEEIYKQLKDQGL
jgi:hypothetical protein